MAILSNSRWQTRKERPNRSTKGNIAETDKRYVVYEWVSEWVSEWVRKWVSDGESDTLVREKLLKILAT